MFSCWTFFFTRHFLAASRFRARIAIFFLAFSSAEKTFRFLVFRIFGVALTIDLPPTGGSSLEEFCIGITDPLAMAQC